MKIGEFIKTLEEIRDKNGDDVDVVVENLYWSPSMYDGPVIEDSDYSTVTGEDLSVIEGQLRLKSRGIQFFS